MKNIEKKVKNDERLNLEDCLKLYESDDIIKIGMLADFVKQRRYGKKVFYVYNQHLNYTNICFNKCLFCAYSKDKTQEGAYTFSFEDIEKELKKTKDYPIKEYHIVGGLNKDIEFDYYFDMLKLVKKTNPEATIKAFTAVEIDHLSKISNLSVDTIFDKLKEAGLEMMPGGGAEILNDRIHNKLFPKKIGKERWLEIVKKAHLKGVKTNATMLYGHIETKEEKAEHLMTLRCLQDETGGFTAFIPLKFHPKNTKLSHINESSILEDLKNISISRLVLDNFDHIKAYWIMLGEYVAQIALLFGADDLDGTIIEEKITHTAGAMSQKGLTKQKLENLIKKAGLIPTMRDSFYNEI